MKLRTIMKPKLIRDSIPDMPNDNWVEINNDYAYKLLKEKLHEEVQELAESDYKDLDEFADILEVLYSLARKAKFTPKTLEVARIIKLKERGGFSNKMLTVSDGDS